MGDEQEVDLDLSTCPYFQRYIEAPGADPNGICGFSCTSEPACITDEPVEGWPAERVGALEDRERRKAEAAAAARDPEMIRAMDEGDQAIADGTTTSSLQDFLAREGVEVVYDSTALLPGGQDGWLEGPHQVIEIHDEVAHLTDEEWDRIAASAPRSAYGEQGFVWKEPRESRVAPFVRRVRRWWEARRQP